MEDFSPYQSPKFSNSPGARTHHVVKPAVVTWYQVYTVLMTLLYFALVVLGVVLIAFSGEMADEGSDPLEFVILGSMYSGLGFVFSLAYLIGVLVPRKKWAWIYAIVLIAFGLTSCCTLPACIPLLIFWLKPETKAYFGMRP